MDVKPGEWCRLSLQTAWGYWVHAVQEGNYRALISQDLGQICPRTPNKALSEQRVTLTEEKTANLATLALGAKLERALDRRMSAQDAVMRPNKRASVTETEQEKA